jgi:cysteinyl-tRNA synthetase
LNSELVDELISAVAADFHNDLDTPKAMIKLRSIEKIEASDGERRSIIEGLDPLLGLDLVSARKARPLPALAVNLLEERAAARASKDFALSDKLRDELLKMGITIQDSSNGQEWSWSVEF